MDSLNTIHTTAYLGAPENWDKEKDGECFTLPVVQVDDRMISFWRPTKAELEKLNAGHPIRLHIVGSSHPPVMLDISGDIPLVLEHRPND